MLDQMTNSNQILQSDLLVLQMEVTYISPEKVNCQSKRGHLEEAGR